MNRRSVGFLLIVVMAILLAVGPSMPAAAQTLEPLAPDTTDQIDSLDSASALATSVSAGADHSCALTPAGGVKCWGENGFHQMGDGTTTNRRTPVDVVGLTSGVKALALSVTKNCALTTAGGVKCWGSTLTDIPGLTSGVISLAAGSWHVCAVTSAGGVKCWGENAKGQLGDGTTVDRATPVDVVGLASGVKAVTAGETHTCALMTTGAVKCWGENLYGRLGDGTSTDRLTPVAVSGLTSGVNAIAAGSRHSCALTSAGGIMCWGWNQFGQVGDNSTTNRLAPVAVSGLTSGVKSIAAGSSHTCAVTIAGGLKCWGKNAGGQIGDNTTTHRYLPVDVIGLTSSVSAVSGGNDHTCALTSAGDVKCWGKNERGQLGDNTNIDHRVAAGVFGLSAGIRAIAVSAGGEHACIVTTAGGAKCWGKNDQGQLGDGTTINRATPVDVVGLTSGVRAVSAGSAHTCALTTGGSVKCWGKNAVGQLGDGTTINRLTPADVIGLTSGVKAIAAGGAHTCARTSADGLKCWGLNLYGQLGDGTVIDRATPLDVSGLTSGVSAVSAGENHTCALTTAGAAKCWGRNNGSQLGDNSTTNRRTPVDVSGMGSGVSAISAGGSHTCALTAAAGAKCWGSNQFGQLGDTTTTNRPTPVDVSGMTSTASAIAAGSTHTCARTTAGGLKCWGDNQFGKLGDGTTNNRSGPADVSGMTSGVNAASAGNGHTCALTMAGAVKCWGWNASSQLGDNTTTDRLTPVGVTGFGDTAPTVTSFSPTGGPAGTSVTINGTDFIGTTVVRFNGINAAAFTVNSATQITAVVPFGAVTGKISVITPAGTGTSAADFAVILPPTIAGFSPNAGPTGSSVTITGTNLTGATTVKFNTTNAASFTVNSATQITAVVAAGTTTGKVSVTTVAGTATSAADFTVVPPPTITGFNPASGPTGTSVVISGTNLTGATVVKFNTTIAPMFVINSATQITVAVPAGATTGKISVTTPGGVGVSASNFTVVPPPTVTGFNPASGAAGASVVINGTNLTGATVVKFNTTNATTFTVNSATQITAKVPAGATTGKISVTTPGGTATSAGTFTVIPPPPSITSFSPTSGPVGTSVVIDGTNFTGAKSVKIGGKLSSFTVNSAMKITAVVAPGARTGTITVVTPSGAATSIAKFTVLVTR